MEVRKQGHGASIAEKWDTLLSFVSAQAEVTLSYMHRWGVLQKTVIPLGSKAAFMVILLYLKILCISLQLLDTGKPEAEMLVL